MNPFAWADSVDVAMTVCDRDGIILYMNEKAMATFAADGGRALIGKNLMDCHPESARRKIGRIMESRQANSYTIEKQGLKKLHPPGPLVLKTASWAGVVELSIVLPAGMPHFIRR